MDEEASQVKQDWVSMEMIRREKEYCSWENVQIAIGTWNVNGRWITEDLDEWLRIGSSEPDLIVLGLQEMDLTTEAYLVDDKMREDHWCQMVEKALEKHTTDYIKVTSKQLIGMLLLVYIKEEHASSVREVSTASAGCGIMGRMGNKGGVAIRLQWRNTLLCFVNSHLAADQGQTERRNQNYDEICSSLRFSLFIFWMGDLNYRINLPEAKLRPLLDSGSYPSVLEFDQLAMEIKAGRVFEGFKEGEVEFCPTYKYDIGTNQFDTSEKRRLPAWCDRILWRTPLEGDEHRIKLSSYTSHMSFSMSDHKPVSATFSLQLRSVNEHQRSQVQASIVRQLDRMENERIPDAAVDKNAIDLGQVEYLTPMSQSLVIKNTGKVGD
ncbi:Endonuclease/exonuclease/phosphatase [Piptocephalis cylindrospora]|uniref:Endonuclease/exonuclease/phosphatase n=1 Tax=Piptocephalis cylindrospora TaxID=1907219 RepID=A0A4P9YBI3_9FUNG|nr:Endonuclease/exonuclease/phosphatase [Piptocephalis cylindrospora]|eukprot:RKP15480.1 Endonuclease/exonuclease/phosphatase [Piptocephalis cylindrospora]